MAKSRKETPANGENREVSFEDSLHELQQIVGELEDGDGGLEASMKRFEEGVSLLRTCYRVLEDAEQRIEVLTGFDADGNPVTAAFDATATATDSSKTAGRRKPQRKSSTKGSSLSSGSDPDEADESDPGTRLF